MVDPQVLTTDPDRLMSVDESYNPGMKSLFLELHARKFCLYLVQLD